MVKLAAISLLIGSLITMGYTVYAFTPDSLPPFFDPAERHKWYVGYQANEISKPFHYWVLTEPDATILEAIRLSSIPEEVEPDTGIVHEHWTVVRANETTFIDQVYAHGETWEIEYDGHYYCVDCYYHYQTYEAEPEPHFILPETYVIHNARHDKELAMGLSTFFGCAWIAFGALWITKRPKPTP
jgi:hypothetical protein